MKKPRFQSTGGMRQADNDRRPPAAEKHEQETLANYQDQAIPKSMESALLKMKDDLGNSADLAIRRISLCGDEGNHLAITYMQSMVEEMRLDEFVIQPIQRDDKLMEMMRERVDVCQRIQEHLLPIGNIKAVSNYKEVFEQLFLGGSIIFIEGSNTALVANIYGGPKRAIQEPITEMSIRGPREGFTESMRLNCMLIRRKIRSPRLWLEQFTIGEVTQTPVGIMYVKGLADEAVLEDLRERLNQIRIDGILESNYVEEFIVDQKWTPFPTIINHERPDAIASNLLEGRVAIVVDGTPFVLVVPSTLNMFFQAAEDYYHNFQMATFLRMLRFVSFVIALLMPSIYVAIIGFHQEMIPTQLLLKLAAQREGVPFPAYLEAFIMEFVFEILREAVLRMPSSAGSAISIVGGLVIGQSVVEAGIVSSAVVIVVAFTAISSFVAPVYSLGIAARLLRFLLLLAASTMGFYGISIVILLILLHLNNLRSFGMPYMKPFAPFYWTDVKDTLLRAPLWKMKRRPQLQTKDNPVREQSYVEPRQEPSQ